MEKKAGFSSLSKTIQNGVRKAVASEKPFFLAPINYLASKATSAKKVDDFYWKYLQKPIIEADMYLGGKARSGLKFITKGEGNLFRDKKILPTLTANGRETGGREYLLDSILAPATKASAFVLPVLGTMKLEEMLKGTDDSQTQDLYNGENMDVINEQDLQKTAAMLEHLNEERTSFEKKAKATELLYKQAEMGQIKFPQTHAEYQEKVAELLSKDLNVVEEAIKMASSTEEINSMGGHLTKQAKVTNARDNFAMSIVEN